MDELENFKKRRQQRIRANAENKALKQCSDEFMQLSIDAKYSYNFSWFGVPVIQYPQDLMAMQEIVYRIKPDIIIDLGVAHGGSLIFYASLLELIGKGTVFGIEVDLRNHNREMIEGHSLFQRTRLFDGSSTDPKIFEQIKQHIHKDDVVLVSADSLHTHEHVLNELKMYSPLVSVGSYMVVFDTIIEDLKADTFSTDPWSIGNNPKTAVAEFLKSNASFEIDTEIENKLMLTAAPSGYLKRVH